MDRLDSETIRAHKGISFVGVSVGFICYDKDGEFVMAKRGSSARDEQGTWDIGAGGLKWSETVENTVRREVKEEYGADIQKLDFLGYRDVFRTQPDGQNTHWLSLTFAALVNREEVRLAEPEVFDEIGWFTLDTLPSPLHSQQIPFFEKYRDQLHAFIH